MEQLTFDSRRVTEGDCFEAYHALYSGGADVVRTDGEFVATVAARRYPRLLLFDRTLSGLAHERPQKLVLSSGFEHATAQLVLSGRLGVTTGDDRRWVLPGEIVAFDMRKPQRTWTDGARYLTVSFSRDIIDASLPAAADFHGRVFAGGVAPLVADQVRSLATCDVAAGPAEAEAVIASLGLMLGAMLGSGATAASGGAAKAEVKLRRAMTFIQQNVGHADLSPALIADRIGVSRSVLYRMFEPHGGVARSIQQQRLLTLRRALPFDRRPILQIAQTHGFVSAAHASRVFRDEFGVTPGQYRTLRRAAASGDRMIHWIDQIQ